MSTLNKTRFSSFEAQVVLGQKPIDMDTCTTNRAPKSFQMEGYPFIKDVTLHTTTLDNEIDLFFHILYRLRKTNSYATSRVALNLSYRNFYCMRSTRCKITSWSNSLIEILKQESNFDNKEDILFVILPHRVLAYLRNHQADHLKTLNN